MRLSVPMLLGILLSATLHIYMWQRLVARTHLPRPWSRIVAGAMIALFLLVPVTTAARLYAPGLAAVLGWVTLTWMALGGLTCVALLASDLLNGAVWSVRRVRGPVIESPERRKFLARLTGGAAVVAASGSVASGMIHARGEHEVVDVPVKLTKLAKGLDGFTIVQLSDLHIGMTIDRAFVQRVVDRTNALAPDLIVLTGDIVDGPLDALADDAAPLAQLRAKHGVYAITGNHEYYCGVDAWIAHLETLGITYLRNRRVTIERAGAGRFELAGVDDFGAHNWKGHGEDIYSATLGRDESLPLVLLAHQPRQVKSAVKKSVDLQLSGHTHGGQIWPWHYIVRVQQGGYLSGMYEVDGTQLYVTCGCGYWGPPVRVLSKLEITRVILRAA